MNPNWEQKFAIITRGHERHGLDLGLVYCEVRTDDDDSSVFKAKFYGHIGYTLKHRFKTVDEAKEACERAVLKRIKETISHLEPIPTP